MLDKFFLFNSSPGDHCPEGIPASLWETLNDCIALPKKLDERLDALERQRRRATNDLDREYVEWQVDVLKKRVDVAARTARARKKHLLELDTPEKRSDELEKCRKDTLYWYKWYAWTSDPRENYLPNMPFVLFDFQERMVQWLEELIFLKRDDGFIEKSRDQGATWVLTAFSCKHFLFAPRFDALLGSRIEDLVDMAGDLASMFEKLRFQLRMLPEWMLPHGFDWSRDSNYCRIINPETGTAITGEAPTTNFGRAGRYLFMIFDELAAWPRGGFAAWAAASQSSRSKIVCSTPQGMLNKNAELRFKSNISLLTLLWTLHPWKDDRWFRYQAKTMSRAVIAQEILIDYEASQAEQIFPMWDELRSVITWEEFADYFGSSARDEFERPKIPDGWMLGMGVDWGSTLHHPCAVLWVARPAEWHPLRDCVFVYREYIAPEGSTPRQVALAIRKLEAPWRENDRMSMRIMSHEAKSERDTFIQEHGLPFEPWDTDYNQGIAQLQNYMELRDKPHPFKKVAFPGDHKKKPLTKHPRLFLIVEEAQGIVVWEDGKHRIRGGSDDRGLARLRLEVPRYHYPVSEEGKAVAARRPFKLFDDALDVLRALAAQWFPAATELTDEMKFEKQMRPELKRTAFEESPIEDRPRLWLSRQLVMEEQRYKEKQDMGTRAKFWRNQFWEREE